jgi:zinc protease
MSLNIEFEQYFLQNGLRVILQQDKRVPIAAVNIWYHTGSKNEVPGKTGYAHLFEHMMFQGSENIEADLHFKLIQSAGGTLNGSTFFDRTNYFETLPSHYLEMGLWLEADRMGFLLPALTQQKLDTQLDVVKNERRQRVDNQPYGLWLEKMLELAYPPDFPYHWPVIGYMADLEKAKMADVKEFFKNYYAPNNASLVVAGDFEIENTRQLVEKYFADIPAYPDIPAFSKKFDKYHSGELRLVLSDKVQFPRIYMAYHLPAYGTGEFYQADLLSDVLSAGKSSRLYQSLVYKQQLAQGAQAFLLPMEETSLLIFVTTAKPGIKIEKLEQALQIEIDELCNKNPEDQEVRRVKNQIEARKIRELQSVAARADYLNQFAMYFNDPDLINTEIDRYEEVTAHDIKQFSLKYLQTNNRVVLHFLPE